MTNSTESRVPRMMGLPASTSGSSAMRGCSVIIDVLSSEWCYPKTSSAAMRAGRPRSQQRSIDGLRNRLAAREGIGVAAEVAGAQRLLAEHALDRVYDGAAGVLLAEVVEHHGARPDLADGIGDALPGNVGRGAVNRLEHRRVLAFRVDVAARRETRGSGAVVSEGVRVNDDQSCCEPTREPARMTGRLRG